MPLVDALLSNFNGHSRKNLEMGLLGKLVLAQHSRHTLPHKLMWALSRLAGAKRFVPVQSTVASLTTAAPAKPARSLGLRALLAVPVAAFAGWVVSDKDRAVLAVALPTRFVRVVATAATITLGATSLAQRVGCQVVMINEPAPYTPIGMQERQQEPKTQYICSPSPAWRCMRGAS